MQIYSTILYCAFAPQTRDVTFSKLYRHGESIGDKKLSVEHSEYGLVVYARVTQSSEYVWIWLNMPQ